MTEKHMETINFRFYECVLEISNEKSTVYCACYVFSSNQSLNPVWLTHLP